jgi:hypothetical protein
VFVCDEGTLGGVLVGFFGESDPIQSTPSTTLLYP